LLFNDKSTKQPPNLPYLFIHPIAEILQPNVAIAPTVVTVDNNGYINPISPTNSTPLGKVGRTFLSKEVQQLAIMCKFDNAEKFIG
jgi:hypothetical protein